MQYPGKLISSAEGKIWKKAILRIWVLLFSFMETCGKNSINLVQYQSYVKNILLSFNQYYQK